MDDFAHIVGEDVHFRGRSPSGERGLKSWLSGRSCDHHASLPIRGAWIEIRCRASTNACEMCRSPSGERGLKSSICDSQQWRSGRSPSGERGLKFAGHAEQRGNDGRSPSGERGLKWSEVDVRSQRPASRSPSGERGLKS